MFKEIICIFFLNSGDFFCSSSRYRFFLGIDEKGYQERKRDRDRIKRCHYSKHVRYVELYCREKQFCCSWLFESGSDRRPHIRYHPWNQRKDPIDFIPWRKIINHLRCILTWTIIIHRNHLNHLISLNCREGGGRERTTRTRINESPSTGASTSSS